MYKNKDDFDDDDDDYTAVKGVRRACVDEGASTLLLQQGDGEVGTRRGEQ